MNDKVLGFLPRTRWVGYGFIAIPISFLLLFAVGEIIGRDITGLIHLLQLFPLIVFALLARKKPKLAGICLSSLAVVLGVSYPFAMTSLEFWVKIIVELILFLPPFLAGIFFIELAR